LYINLKFRIWRIQICQKDKYFFSDIIRLSWWHTTYNDGCMSMCWFRHRYMGPLHFWGAQQSLPESTTSAQIDFSAPALKNSLSGEGLVHIKKNLDRQVITWYMGVYYIQQYQWLPKKLREYCTDLPKFSTLAKLGAQCPPPPVPYAYGFRWHLKCDSSFSLVSVAANQSWLLNETIWTREVYEMRVNEIYCIPYTWINGRMNEWKNWLINKLMKISCVN